MKTLLLLFSLILMSCYADSLDSYIKSKMKKAHIPSLSLAVVTESGVEQIRQYGYADPKKEIPISPFDVYMVASISKTVAATSVMQLYDAGLIELDDDINKHIDFQVTNPKFPSVPITIRMLLTHTSSISDAGYSESFIVDGDSPIPLGSFLASYLVNGGEYFKSENYSNGAPGTAYDYSNIGAALLGYLVEAVKKVDFARDNTDTVLRPLNMTSSAWHLKDIPSDVRVVTPSYWKKKGFKILNQYGYPDYPNGQLRTTIQGIANHLYMVMNGGSFGGKQIIKEETVKTMLTIQEGPAKDEQQALIWYYKDLAGWTLCGHNGGDDGVATEAFFDPESKVGFVILTNGEWDQKGYTKAIDKIEKKVLSTFTDKKKKNKDKDKSKDKRGLFASSRLSRRPRREAEVEQ